MKNSGIRYYVHRLSVTALRVPVLALLGILYLQSWLPEKLWNSYQYILQHNSYSTAIYCHLEAIELIICVVFILLPVLELSPLKNRRNMDTLLGVPVSRTKIALAHFLCGLTEASLIHTAVYIYYACVLYPYSNFLQFQLLLPYFFISLGMGICIYSVIAFAFSRANTVWDGIVFIAFHAVVFAFAVSAIYKLIGFDNSSEPEFFLLWNPLDNVTGWFGNRISSVNYYTGDLIYNYAPSYGGRNGIPAWFVVLNQVGLTLACLAGYLIGFVRTQAEKIGGISDSWFGYRIMIPVCAVSLLYNTRMVDMHPAIILGATVVLYIVYRRSFKLRISDLVVIGALLCLCVCGYLF